MHIVEGVDFLLNVVSISCVGIEDLCAGRRSLELGLFGFIIVVIMLSLMVDLMINIIN
jgi:hypothetical protein